MKLGHIRKLAVVFMLACLFLVACGDELAIQSGSSTSAAATATSGGSAATTAKSGTTTSAAVTTVAALTTAAIATPPATTKSAATTAATLTTRAATTAPIATTAASGSSTGTFPSELVYPGAGEFKPTDNFKQVFDSLEASLKGNKQTKYYKTSDDVAKVQTFYQSALDKGGYTKASSSITSGALVMSYIKGVTDVVYVVGYPGSLVKLAYGQSDAADSELLFAVVSGKFS